MKLAVTDACIFIDLFDLELIPSFFELPFEVHSTVDVYGELNPEQRQTLEKWIKQEQFILHNLDAEKRNQIQQAGYPKGLSETDKTVLHLARDLEALMLSSDKVLRNTASKLKLEVHGILWIIEKLIEYSHLSKNEGIAKYRSLCTVNITIGQNAKLLKEIEKRIKVLSE
jgi:predicted nucleic acid-binding protein